MKTAIIVILEAFLKICYGMAFAKGLIEIRDYPSSWVGYFLVVITASAVICKSYEDIEEAKRLKRKENSNG